MSTPRLPGIATIAALVLAAIMAASLSVTGPIPIPYEVLKDFQTVGGALIALIGASLVYRGATLSYRAAMAKVSLDREIDARNARRRLRGIYIRARYAAKVMSFDATRFYSNLDPRPMSRPVPRPETPTPIHTMDITTIVFRTAGGIDEAWNVLDAFPREIAEQIADIKLTLVELQDHLIYENSPVFEVREPLPVSVKMLRDDLTSLTALSDDLAGGLTILLQELHEY